MAAPTRQAGSQGHDRPPDGLTPWQPPRHRQQPNQAFGPALRAARLRHGWSLRDLARVVGTNNGYLCLLENRKRAPSVVMVAALARALVLTKRERAVFKASGLHGVGRDWTPPEEAPASRPMSVSPSAQPMESAWHASNRPQSLTPGKAPLTVPSRPQQEVLSP